MCIEWYGGFIDLPGYYFGLLIVCLWWLFVALGWVVSGLWRLLASFCVLFSSICLCVGLSYVCFLVGFGGCLCLLLVWVFDWFYCVGWFCLVCSAMLLRDRVVYLPPFGGCFLSLVGFSLVALGVSWLLIIIIVGYFFDKFIITLIINSVWWGCFATCVLVGCVWGVCGAGSLA